jgi:hypothetical protein
MESFMFEVAQSLIVRIDRESVSKRAVGTLKGRVLIDIKHSLHVLREPSKEDDGVFDITFDPRESLVKRPLVLGEFRRVSIISEFNAVAYRLQCVFGDNLEVIEVHGHYAIKQLRPIEKRLTPQDLFNVFKASQVPSDNLLKPIPIRIPILGAISFDDVSQAKKILQFVPDTLEFEYLGDKRPLHPQYFRSEREFDQLSMAVIASSVGAFHGSNRDGCGGDSCDAGDQGLKLENPSLPNRKNGQSKQGADGRANTRPLHISRHENRLSSSSVGVIA